jgi:predicted transcriptional regulator
MELLSYVRRNNVTSVRALAKALNRDYSNVHADYDAIETKIAI